MPWVIYANFEFDTVLEYSVGCKLCFPLHIHIHKYDCIHKQVSTSVCTHANLNLPTAESLTDISLYEVKLFPLYYKTLH